MTETINFYGHRNLYGEFSNFYEATITINGKIWWTTEAYFQAQKFPHHPEYQEMIRKERSPFIVKKLGGSRKIKIREDWEQIKDEVMYTALQAKFIQHDKLKALLLSTGEALLVEHTSNDSYWGDGLDGQGQNMLGKLLCRLRSELRTEIPVTPVINTGNTKQ